MCYKNNMKSPTEDHLGHLKYTIYLFHRFF